MVRPERRGGAAQSLRSKGSRDHHNRRCAGRLVTGLDQPTGRRGHTQRAKEARGHPAGLDLLRLAGAGERGHAPARGTEGIECRLLVSDGLNVDHGQGPDVGGRDLLIHSHQPARMRIRQFGEEHTIDHAEHRRGGTDGEREYHDRGQGEPGIAPQGAEREPGICGKVGDGAHPAGVQGLLLVAVRASEGEPSLATRRRRIGPRADPGHLLLLEMEAHLVVELVAPAPGRQQGPQSLEQVGDHGSAIRTRRMPLTAAAVRCQTSVSVSSWCWPLVVNP